MARADEGGDGNLRYQDFAMTAMRAIAVGLFVALLAPVYAQAGSAGAPCHVKTDLVRLDHALPRVARKLASGTPLTIVAIGSSSTAGAGASKPELTYPSRLKAELATRFPHHDIKVINRGVNGEEIKDMLRRFDRAVIAEQPDLVLWQLGTNAVLRNHPFVDRGAAIREGLGKIKRAGADVVLIDPQFAPKVIARPDAEKMVRLIGLTAKAENVDLFQRYALMRNWRDRDKISFETFVSPDGLHMNDWSYGCLAKSLAAAIAEAATRPIASAAATLPREPF